MAMIDGVGVSIESEQETMPMYIDSSGIISQAMCFFY